MLQLRYQTSASGWTPSIHLVHNTVLFITADELVIHKVMPYGKPNKQDKAEVIEEGEFVSIMLSATKSPFHTILTIFAKTNGSTCMTMADDLRQQNKPTTLLGLGVMLYPNIQVFRNKC